MGWKIKTLARLIDGVRQDFAGDDVRMLEREAARVAADLLAAHGVDTRPDRHDPFSTEAIRLVSRIMVDDDAPSTVAA